MVLSWYVRFGVLYVLVADIVKLSVILSVKDLYARYVLYALFGIFLLAYIPNVDTYVGYIPLQTESVDDIKYEVLRGREHIFPQRHANIISRIYFGWMTPLMEQGYQKPITEKDVWISDTWDRTETLNSKNAGLKNLRSQIHFFYDILVWRPFQSNEFIPLTKRGKMGWSLQRGDPSWIGYVYAFSIFVCVVAFVYRKSLRLTHEARKNVLSGRITNMITTDVNALQQVCNQLHGLWSAPFRITLSMILLYQQLGVASLVGSLILILMFPVQVPWSNERPLENKELNAIIGAWFTLWRD
ncbi:ABC transporter C family member 12-like protein [Tanacetum coccineum]